MILKEHNTRATIDNHNKWVYILADTVGTNFVEKELGYEDASELPTTYIDDGMYFTFSPDMDEYVAAWQFAKEAKIEDFNKMAEKTLKDAGCAVWEDIKPRVDEYIATVNAAETTTGNYVYNLIDELVEPFRWTDVDSIGEDYYLNMLYSYEPFFNKLDDTIHEDFDESVESSFMDKLKEANDQDIAWQEIEIKSALEDITNDFTKAAGSVQTEYEDEVSIAKRILKQYYKVVEVSDGRNFDNDSITWNISYAKPLEVK